MNQKRILIMAAGTGGHVFPGLAIAKIMQERGWHVTWLGTAHGMENQLVPEQGITLERISFEGLRGKGKWHAFKNAFKMLAGFKKCYAILGKVQPNVVLGMGGYVTVPGGMMARLRGIPLVLVNADATLLMSNDFLTPYAQTVLFGLPGNTGRAQSKAMVSGNPVRQEILDVASPSERFAEREGPLKILILGGSLGAQALNECLPEALSKIAVVDRPIVTHQSGRAHVEALHAAYDAANVDATVVPFIDDMAQAYADADLVICRAGAITVSELTAAGVASILVPLEVSTTSHQRSNAKWLAAKRAAVYLPQSAMTPVQLAGMLRKLTREECARMAGAAHRQGYRHAGQTIAKLIESLSELKSR